MFTHYTVVINDVNEKIPNLLYKIWTILLMPLYCIVLGIGTINNIKVGAGHETINNVNGKTIFRFNKQEDAIRLMRFNKLLFVTNQTLYYN